MAAEVRAIMAVSESILGLLENSYSSDLFDADLEFATFSTADYESRSLDRGVSLALNRVAVKGPGQAATTASSPDLTPLPLELHFTLTVWAAGETLQQRIARWMMLTLQQSPVLPAALLNTYAEGAFRADEAFELTPGDAEDRKQLGVWNRMGAYRRSMPYVARMVRIDSAEARNLYNKQMLSTSQRDTRL